MQHYVAAADTPEDEPDDDSGLAGEVVVAILGEEDD
jgi:hypothetical protein